jgi:chaperonin GroES
MKNKSKGTFTALNEFIQIEPIEDKEQKAGGVILAKTTKERPARGTIISMGEGRTLQDGTFVKPDVKVGDTVVYNPHMVGYELEEDGKTTLIISNNALYGKYK